MTGPIVSAAILARLVGETLSDGEVYVGHKEDACLALRIATEMIERTCGEEDAERLGATRLGKRAQ